MSGLKVVIFILSSIFLCSASYHEQYRVPKSSNDKWESYVLGENEYIIQNLPVNWDVAMILCRGYHNGTLAIVDTSEKADFLAEALSESQLEIESAWVGARRSDASSGYRWNSGAPLRRYENDIYYEARSYKNYPDWLNRTAVPVPDGGADCVALDRVNHDQPVFLDLQCLIERPFVCEREAQPEYLVKEISTIHCWSALYRIYSGKLTWDQAAGYCVMKKMSLANIETISCLHKIGMSMLKMRPSVENAWIGGRGELGQWKWIDTRTDIVHSLMTERPELWPPIGNRTTLKQSGCLQVDRHASHPPVFLEARCERKMHFICYESPFIKSQALYLSSLAPPSDDNYNYILVRKSLFWQHAHDNCLKMNGTLAHIENNEVLVQLLLLMGENEGAPVDHIWLEGRLNLTKDIATDKVSSFWYNPVTGRKIPDPKNVESTGGYMPPWLEEEYTMDNSCLNLDRQNHLTGLVYGLPCDTAQYSVCMIDKSLPKPVIERAGATDVDIALSTAD